jgi:DIS3-like exonuclease 1
MLPSVLSERVCSLRHRVDRFAGMKTISHISYCAYFKLLINIVPLCLIVSVIWTLDRNYKVLDTWFGRSVIRSACEMEYEQAQELFNGADTVNGLDKKLGQRLKKSIVKLVDILRVVRVSRSELLHINAPDIRT